MPAEEVQNTKKRFMPKLGDKPEAVSSKLRAYKYFINNAVDLMNPQGLTRSQMTPAQATTAMKNAVDKSFESTNESSQPLNPKIGDKWTDPKTGKTYTYRG
ncbi:MAG: hypothetical protein DRQ35_02250 [Gammaproteobacteria bacterium]|nr:MAG: hypothetical protein DRQ35_02250 [Gammaproteobacteria bacterium]